MDRVAVRSKISPEEYLAWERVQPTKHEYYEGEIFAMAGASHRHNRLCSQVIAALVIGHRPGCSVLTSDQRVQARPRGRYVYPDVTVVCGKSEIVLDDVLVNPTIVVEVLSRSTEQVERVVKWESYRRLASLCDYVLVPQLWPRIEHYERGPDGSWIFREAGPGEQIMLSTGVALVVDDVFEGVMDLPGDEPPPEAGIPFDAPS